MIALHRLEISLITIFNFLVFMQLLKLVAYQGVHYQKFPKWQIVR